MGAKYEDAPDMAELAQEMIREHELDAGHGARIKYLYKISKKSTFLGKCARATGAWKHLTDYDFIIIIWKDWYVEASPAEQHALVFHELCHIEALEDDHGMAWALRKHRVTAFPEEVRHFGFWNGPLMELEKAAQESPK